jgi:hypothetical protein
MGADVMARAEDLPFADGSFDTVGTRIAPHHFEDVGRAMGELARVAQRVVLVADTRYLDEAAEEAERVRDPTHVRSYSEDEWRALFEQAGLTVEAVEMTDVDIDFDAWLARAGCEGGEAERVHELVRGRIREGRLSMPRIALKGRK